MSCLRHIFGKSVAPAPQNRPAPCVLCYLQVPLYLVPRVTGRTVSRCPSQWRFREPGPSLASPHHPWRGRILSSGRIKLVRSTQTTAPEGQRGAEEALRVTARQQEAVAHLGQLALAGAAVAALLDDTVPPVAPRLARGEPRLLEF